VQEQDRLFGNPVRQIPFDPHAHTFGGGKSALPRTRELESHSLGAGRISGEAEETGWHEPPARGDDSRSYGKKW